MNTNEKFSHQARLIAVRPEAFIQAFQAIAVAVSVEAAEKTKGLKTAVVLANMAGVEAGTAVKGVVKKENGDTRYFFIAIGTEKGCNIILAGVEGDISFHSAGCTDRDDFVPNLDLEVVLKDDVVGDVEVLLETLFVQHISQAAFNVRAVARESEAVAVAVKPKVEEVKTKTGEKPSFMDRMGSNTGVRRTPLLGTQTVEGAGTISVTLETSEDGGDESKKPAGPATAIIISHGQIQKQ